RPPRPHGPGRLPRRPLPGGPDRAAAGRGGRDPALPRLPRRRARGVEHGGMVRGACPARDRGRVEFRQMEDFYRENILDHYKNPRNAGHLEHPTTTADGVTPRRGGEPAVEPEIEGDAVQDVRFNGRGCAISQAAASMIS